MVFFLWLLRASTTPVPPATTATPLHAPTHVLPTSQKSLQSSWPNAGQPHTHYCTHTIYPARPPPQVFFAIFMAAFGAAQAQMFFPDVARGKSATQVGQAATGSDQYMEVHITSHCQSCRFPAFAGGSICSSLAGCHTNTRSLSWGPPMCCAAAPLQRSSVFLLHVRQISTSNGRMPITPCIYLAPTPHVTHPPPSSVQRVFGIIDRQPLIDASSPEGAQPLECVGAIELRDITFAYPARSEVGW